MAFTYAVPLPTFEPLLRQIDGSLHSEFLEALRQRIHEDLGRRLTGPDSGTLAGQARVYFDSNIAHGDMLFYSPVTYDEAIEKTGAPRETLSHFLFSRGSLMRDPEAMLLIRQRSWRYPGDAGNGIFAQSVNSVVAKSRDLLDEYKKKSRELRNG